MDETPLLSEKPIDSPIEAALLLGKYLNGMDREVVCVVNLQADLKPINFTIASIGALNYAVCHPREILKSSILSNASSILLVHSHPSGNLKPSRQDCNITARLVNLCEMIDIPLVDHIIVGRNTSQYYSFKENSIMPKATNVYPENPGQIAFGSVAEGRVR